MSTDEQCQVKCCERRLMCFISVCLNCPGTLESLNVNQIRCNETRLRSSEDTCLSAVTQANGGKRALPPFQAPRLQDSIALSIKNCSCISKGEDKRSISRALANIWSSEAYFLNVPEICSETPYSCF